MSIDTAIYKLGNSLLSQDQFDDSWQLILDEISSISGIQSSFIIDIASDSNAVGFYVDSCTVPNVHHNLQKKVLSAVLLASSSTCPPETKPQFTVVKSENLNQRSLTSRYPDEEFSSSLRLFSVWSQPTSHCYFGVEIGNEEQLSQDVWSELECFVPLLSFAYQTQRQSLDSDSADLRNRALLESFRIPVALFNSTGRLLYSNKAMSSFLHGKSDTLNASQDYITSLGKLIANTANTKYIKGQSMNKLPALFPDASIYACIDQSLVNKADCVLVYVVSLAHSHSLSEQSLIDMFGLTPSEARVCRSIHEGRSLQEIAALNGVSKHTVRKQLNSCFKKSGCINQISLINLLASIPVH